MSNMDQIMAALFLQSQRKADMEKRFPTPVVLRRRESQILQGAQNRRFFEQSSVSEVEEQNLNLNLKTTYIGVKNYSKEPIHNLSHVRFRDMQIPLVHKGKYVLCRTVSLPNRIVSIDFMVEDPSGDVLLLTIYDFPLPFFANAQQLDDIFPIGTLLAIREPYLKTSSFDVNPFIRVDAPTDIIFLDNQSNILQDVVWKFPNLGPQRPPHVTALECKLDGNKKFQGGRWLAAAIAYTKGLSLTSSHDLATALRLNRSESYLKLGYFSAALADAQLVLSDKALPQHSINLGKALLKAGKAHYFQDKFKEALESFMQLKNIPDGISEAKRWIDKTHLRISEQNNGDYDWYEMFKNCKVVGSRLDVADYIGPIEVRNLGSCGRGIVASRDISPGELLLVCKPFVSAFPDKSPKNGLNSVVNSVETASQVIILHKCIQKLYGNPSMKNLVYDLYASAFQPPSPDLYPPQIGSEILHEPLHTSIDIDVSRVEYICLMNTFGILQLDDCGSTPLAWIPSALYLLPSMFNHSCYPNTFHFFLRDVMVVRAVSKISKGDQVFLSYTGLRPYEERSERLKKWGFSCQCELCQDDRKEGAAARDERERLEAGINDTAQSNISVRANIMELERKIKQVKNTYTVNRHTFKMSLARMHECLAWEFQYLIIESKDRKHYHRPIGEYIQALKALGIPIIDDSVQGKIDRKCRREPPIDKEKFNVAHPAKRAVRITLDIVLLFYGLRDEIRTERWFRAAWLIDDIAIGTGRKVFDERYKDILSNEYFVAITTKIKNLE